MTMHLLGPQFSTLSNKKKKSRQIVMDDKFARDLLDYNKMMRRHGSAEKTIEEYMDYRCGTMKHRKLQRPAAPKLVVSDHRQKYPSGDSMSGSTPARKEQVYTGERKLLGIATMHKSNQVPVFDQQDAIDIAKMRRG